MDILSLSYGNVILKDTDKNFGLVPESYSSYQILEPGDVVMRLTDLQNDHVSLRTGLVKNKGIITSAYLGLKIRHDKLDYRFFHWLLHSYDLQKVYYGMGGGIRQTVGYDDLKWLPILIPNTETQKNIADFLDEKTKVIDELVEKKGKMIELLREKRASLIAHAVTKGLDPKAKMKPSGVDWLGEIPDEWELLPAKALLKERKEKNSNLVSDNILSVMRNIGVIRYADKGNVGNKSSDRPENYKIVYPGDIVLNSMNLVIGSVGISKELGVTSSVYIIYRAIKGKSITTYYHNVFMVEGFQKHLGTFGRGIMELREAVKNGDIKFQFMPHPPLEEQKKIANYVDTQTAKIDKNISLIELSMYQLKEYRSSLIYSAVTGKIKI